MIRSVIVLAIIAIPQAVCSEEVRSVNIWPGEAPGETSRQVGVPKPKRPNEHPPATRIEKITSPQLDVFLCKDSKQPTPAILILPGGGYNYVVVDKEGSEAAQWLNDFGVSAFVLRYRTKLAADTLETVWQRPLQDAQRAMKLIRSKSEEFNIDMNRVGVLGFSAGGQLAAFVTTRYSQPAYQASDKVDQLSSRPDFSLLLYPWKLVDPQTNMLNVEIRISSETPPCFLVHAHDDSSSSLSSLVFYQALKRQDISGELHIYEKGGHGFGMRSSSHLPIAQWTERAEEWLISNKFVMNR